MTKVLQQEEYDFLWQKIKPIKNNDFEIVQQIPNELGYGYAKSIQLGKMNLYLFNYQLYDDLCIEEYQEQNELSWELGFNISGNRSGKKSGENFFTGGINNNLDTKKWTWITYNNEPIIKVDLHLDSDSETCKYIISSLNDLPQSIRKNIVNNQDDSIYFHEINQITPAMKYVLEQIINCPFENSIKKIYLEGKCLELISLKLEQLKDNHKLSNSQKMLKSDDIERIIEAKKILTQNLEQPPTLKELARRVSLNDYKLKIGFKQVFGTTVFGYLYYLRMEKAKQLLNQQTMSIKDVAKAVGYVNQSHFAAAFRKLYGVNPKSFLK